MIKPQIVTLKVNNWDKHNPRNDRDNMPWFKFRRDFFRDTRIRELPQPAKILFIYLMCEQAKSGTEPIQFSYRFAALDLDSSVQELQKSLSILCAYNLVSNQQPNGNQNAPSGCLEESREEESRVDPVGVPPPDPTEALILKFSKIHADEDWVRLEHGKARSWYAERGKKFTERAFGNWLRRGLDNKPIPAAARPVLVEKYWDADANAWLPVPPRNDP